MASAKPASSIDDVELPVGRPAREVEIGGADARPAPVRHGGLGVQHRAVPLEDADAGLEQRAVARAHDRLQRRHVARAGHEQAHVHAVPRRLAQRLHIGRGGDEIGVGEPELALRRRGDELVDPVGAAACRARR